MISYAKLMQETQRLRRENRELKLENNNLKGAIEHASRHDYGGDECMIDNPDCDPRCDGRKCLEQ